MSENVIFWIACVLSLIHALSTPWFFARTRDYARFIVSYILYTAGILIVEYVLILLAPRDLGWGGMALLYPLLLPAFVTAPLVIFVRTIYHMVQLSRQPVRTMPPSMPPLPLAARPPTTPAIRPSKTFRDVLTILAFAVIIQITGSEIRAILLTIGDTIFPHPMRAPGTPMPAFVPPNPIWVTLQEILWNVLVAEVVWQFWTRRISRTDDTLYTRPLAVHALILVLVSLPPLVSLPALQRQTASFSQVDPVSQAMQRPPVHPRVRLPNTASEQSTTGAAPGPGVRQSQPGAPIVLAGSMMPIDDVRMSNAYAVWLEHPDSQTLGPSVGVFKFQDNSTQRVQLPFFANADGYTDSVSLYLLQGKVVAVGSTRIAIVDLQTGVVSTWDYRGYPFYSPGDSRQIYLSDRWMVVARGFQTANIDIVNLQNFDRRSLTISNGDAIKGITEDALILANWQSVTRIGDTTTVSPRPLTYVSVDLSSFDQIPLSPSDVWWLPQLKGSVTEELMMTQDDNSVSMRDGYGGIRQVDAGLIHTVIAATENYLFWTPNQDYDGSSLMRTDLKTGVTERVLNGPGRLDVDDYAVNDNYFLETAQSSAPFNAADPRTYPIQVQLAPMQTASITQ